MQGTVQQQYLKAMGVHSYVPRFQLPGALASEQGDFIPAQAAIDAPPCQEQQANEALAGSVARVDKQASAAARAALDIDVSSAVAPARKAEPSKIKDAPAAESSAPRFGATLVDTAIGLMFLTDTSEADLTAAEKRLLANIAKAVGRQFAEESSPAFQASTFNWPMPNTGPLVKGRMAQGKAEARDAFTGFLLSHAERWRGSRLVVLGEALEAYIAADHLDRDGLTVIQHSDVRALMNRAQEKAQLWQKLCASFL